MSGLDYSTFSLWYAPSVLPRPAPLTAQAPFSSALTPSQPPPPRSYPADNTQQHVAEDVIDSHIYNMQRDDLRSRDVTDRPRAVSGPHRGQGSAGPFAFPGLPTLADSADDIQGNILCAQLGEFHFTPQFGHDEAVNAPTAITENSSWRSPHGGLHYPTPVRGSVSQRMKGNGGIAEDARPGLTLLHDDVTPVRARRASMVITDRQLGTNYDFGLAGPSAPLPSLAMDVSTFLPGGMITSPSPPSAYHDDDFSAADACAHPFSYAEQLPAMTRTPARDPASHYSQTVQSLGGFQDGVCLDHRFAAGMATPFPGYSSSQSPHDHPICEQSPSFGTAIHAEELPRPGSAPPLIDSQVPFVGDARAVLQSSENAASDHVHRPHAGWYPQPVALSAPSPRSSPRRAGSIGHNAQKTPPGSRHLRRWSSVTNPALRASPPPLFPSFAPNIVPFPRYPPPPTASSEGAYAHFSPSAESEGDDATFGMPHAAVDDPEQQQAPPMRAVVRCDGHLVDDESWTAALQRPDKLLHVYECFWDLGHSPCGMWIEGDQSSVADHLALFHGFRGGEVTTRCLWRECPKPHMKGTSIARHVVTHIGFRVKCNTCKHEFARVDACNRAHSRSGCLGVGQPMYGDLQRVLDARKIDPSRPSKKRRTED